MGVAETAVGEHVHILAVEESQAGIGLHSDVVAALAFDAHGIALAEAYHSSDGPSLVDVVANLRQDSVGCHVVAIVDFRAGNTKVATQVNLGTCAHCHKQCSHHC